MGFDGLRDQIPCDGSYGCDARAACPPRWHALLKPGELVAQFVGGRALDVRHHPKHALPRVGIPQEMDMIGQDFPFNDRGAILGLLRQEQILHPGCKRLVQHLPPIVQAEEYMVVTAQDHLVIGMVGLVRLPDFPIPSVIDDSLECTMRTYVLQ